MCWERGLREVFLLRRRSLLSIVFIALPLPCPRRYQLQCKSKRAFVSHPLAERGGVLLEQSLHSGCIGCIEIIHFDILNMKRYDFLMRNMGWDVLCTPPYHPPECQYCGFSEGCVFAKIHPRAAAFSVKREFGFVWFWCLSHYACYKPPSLMFGFGGESWLQVPRLSHPAAPRGASGHPSPCSARWRPNI